MFIRLLFAGLFSVLISTLTQAGGGGLLFRFTCSVMLQGGRGAADRYHWRVWGALTVFRPHWVCPAHRCVLSPSTLLRLPAALYGAGPALRTVPVFGFSTKVQTWLGLRFVPSPAPAAQAARSLTGALSPGFGAPSPLCGHFRARQWGACALCLFSRGSWPLAATLPLDVDHPESQEVFG